MSGLTNNDWIYFFYKGKNIGYMKCFGWTARSAWKDFYWSLRVNKEI